VHAFNIAIALLPDEWENEDLRPLQNPLEKQRCDEIETQVHERIQKHRQQRVEKDQNVFDFPDYVSVSLSELLAPASLS
jgi:hypothetical protein